MILNSNYLRTLLTLLFLAGGIGVTLPSTKELFLQLTPYFLWINGFICFFLYPKRDKNSLILLLLLVVSTWLIEVNGVHTGKIFGQYHYGPTLGFKLFDVPITIGINWLILLLGSSAVVEDFIPNGGIFGKAAIAAGFMTLLDIFIEPVAIALNYWSWENNEIPLQNFGAWWIIAFILHFFMIKYELNVKSSLFRFIFVLEFIYFLLINLINSIIF